MAASKLIEDLTHVSNIVGALGLSIAAAQRALDANYLDGVERTVVLSKMMLAAKKESDGADVPVEEWKQILGDIVMALAPSRYQYTQTTLNVKLDLAQSLDVTGGVGLGVGVAGVSLNAAFTVGYAFDYRAAAECRTVIHAIPPNQTTLATLIDAAAKIPGDLTLPERSKVDEQLYAQVGEIMKKLTGEDVKKPEVKQ